MTYFIDIDGTICKTNGLDYANAKPIIGRIKTVNNLYNAGHKIIFWTSRGFGQKINYRTLTLTQLKAWKVKYHSLRTRKPLYDVWIDDRAHNAINLDGMTI